MRSLSAALGWAVNREFIDANPCSRVRKLQDGVRERYLSQEETRGLFDAIDALLQEGAITRDHVDCIELITFTAARRGEILALRWKEIDFERKIPVLPPMQHKTGGQNQPKVIPLTSTCLRILKRRHANFGNSDFVFPAPKSQFGYIQNIRYFWLKITKRAGIKDFRIHDFRHAHASFAINAGQSLNMIGSNLGHKKTSTTERYAHLLIDARRPVADEVQKKYNSHRRYPPFPSG